MWDGRGCHPSTQKITYPYTGQLLADLSQVEGRHHRACAGAGSYTRANTRYCCNFETARGQAMTMGQVF